MICPTCHADRTLEPSGLCITCDREAAAGRISVTVTNTGIPGAPRSLFGRPPGQLFDAAEETAAERAALRTRRKPPTVTESPADDYTVTQTPALTGQRRLF